MNALMKQEELQDICELDLFKALVRWSKVGDRSRDDIVSLLSEVRFRLFSSQEFTEHVAPSKLLSDSDLYTILCSLTSRNLKMPAGFSNEAHPRCVKGDVETVIIRSNNSKKTVLASEVTSGKALSFFVNSDAYIMGVQLKLPKPLINFQFESVQVYLKHANGLVAASATFIDGDKDSDIFNFKIEPPYIMIANQIYVLKVYISEEGFQYALESCQDHILTTKSDVEVNIKKLDINPIKSITIAKRMCKNYW